MTIRTVGEPGEDGRVEVTVAYGGIDGVRQLLQFGEHMEVVTPENARRLVARLATHMAHRHAR